MGRTATATRAAAVQCGRIEADQRRLRTRRLRIAFHDRGATAAQQDLGGVDPLWGKTSTIGRFCSISRLAAAADNPARRSRSGIRPRSGRTTCALCPKPSRWTRVRTSDRRSSAIEAAAESTGGDVDIDKGRTPGGAIPLTFGHHTPPVEFRSSIGRRSPIGPACRPVASSSRGCCKTPKRGPAIPQEVTSNFLRVRDVSRLWIAMCLAPRVAREALV